MSAASSHDPQWQAHVERLRRTSSAAPPPTAGAAREAAEIVRGEWTAAPPGRLGRRLLADVEPYLVFVAIARAT